MWLPRIRYHAAMKQFWDASSHTRAFRSRGRPRQRNHAAVLPTAAPNSQLGFKRQHSSRVAGNLRSERLCVSSPTGASVVAHPRPPACRATQCFLPFNFASCGCHTCLSRDSTGPRALLLRKETVTYGIGRTRARPSFFTAWAALGPRCSRSLRMRKEKAST